MHLFLENKHCVFHLSMSYLTVGWIGCKYWYTVWVNNFMLTSWFQVCVGNNLLRVYKISKPIRMWLSLTHLTLVPHICVSELSQHCSYNGLSPVRRQAITWINTGLLSIRRYGNTLNHTSIKIQNFSFTKTHLTKWLVAIRRPFCPEGDDLNDSCCLSRSLKATRLDVNMVLKFGRRLDSNGVGTPVKFPGPLNSKISQLQDLARSECSTMLPDWIEVPEGHA